jgi:hypothetical protein
MVVIDRSRVRGGPVFIAIVDEAKTHLTAGKLLEPAPGVFQYPPGDQRDALDEIVRFNYGLPSGDPDVRPPHAKKEKTTTTGAITVAEIGPHDYSISTIKP